VTERSARDLLWENLREIPAFRALIRTIEGRLLLEHGPLPRPLLDVGCGDGHFAQVFLGEVDVGIDLDLPILRQAARRGVYRGLGAASAAAMPFLDGAFRTVLANCALEHMPDLEGVLREVRRVLQPGGTFVFTVPNDVHNRNLVVGRLLNGAGLHRAAAAYRDWFRRMQHHFHMYAPEEWARRVEAHGFRVVLRRDYLSPRATALLELGHYAGWHNVVAKALFGRWVVLPWRPLFALTERLLLPRVLEDGIPGSSCVFVVAEATEKRGPSIEMSDMIPRGS
jgi:SAM-dependent methyltransferase